VIDRVTASTFHRFTGSGRTSPAIFSCEGEAISGEFVVKLRGGLERKERGLACELYASMLASYFGISCPRPAIVLLENDLIEAIVDELNAEARRAQIMRESHGLNFGTQFLVNLSIWPVDRLVPPTLQEAALKIYAFDALIQNPDRKYNNPNLGTRNDELFVFDHELAFSFLLSIFSSVAPWVLANEDYLEQHVFARALRQVAFSDDFLHQLTNLSHELITLLSDQVPDQWRSEDLEKIERHLLLMSEHAAEFAEEVRRRFV
jgi:hypothetical protein